MYHNTQDKKEQKVFGKGHSHIGQKKTLRQETFLSKVEMKLYQDLKVFLIVIMNLVMLSEVYLITEVGKVE